MATRTIASPGIQSSETDISIISRPTADTNVFVTGFAPQGPTDEIISVGSVGEFEEIFGTPENSAERYLYHTSKKVLESNGNLLVTRMPYGSAAGEGFSNSYSALIYGLSANGATYEDSTEFRLLAPYSLLLTTDEYENLVEGGINWTNNPTLSNANTMTAKLSSAGVIILNSSKLANNNLFEGYYVGLADNSNNNAATDFNALTSLKAVNTITSNYQTFVDVPASRLSFTITAYASSYGSNSLSEIIEGLPTDLDFGSSLYNDSLTLAVFKVRSTVYNQDTLTLDYSLAEAYTGSLNADRTKNDVNGGNPKTFFLEKLVNSKSPNFKLITNPYISKGYNWVDNNGSPNKTVRVDNSARSAFSAGVYANKTDKTAKYVGNVPLKLQRSLRLLENSDDVSIDLALEAGLGTIWVGANARESFQSTGTAGYKQYIFDDTFSVDVDGLCAIDGTVTGLSITYRENYLSVLNQFTQFADLIKKDHLFIADGLRYVYVNGINAKVSKKSDYSFSKHIYWANKNLFGTTKSSYVATYGNWLKTNDVASDQQVWLPASGFVAAKFVEVDRNAYPWTAVGGFNRGTLNGVTDIGVVTTQKQRDLLYKININPIAYFPNDGYVIYGQKTMYKTPSSFDRINVRRLFLYLKKNTEKVLKYFLFEPNTFTTRTRVVAALRPIYEVARLNEGVYDYSIVCDERNNTPDVIDANELKCSSYVQAVRTGEFILNEFISTRTGVNFEEIIG